MMPRSRCVDGQTELVCLAIVVLSVHQMARGNPIPSNQDLDKSVLTSGGSTATQSLGAGNPGNSGSPHHFYARHVTATNSGAKHHPGVESGSGSRSRNSAGRRGKINNGHQNQGRYNVKCKGVYDRGLFARLDRICRDCQNLFRETWLGRACREGCFTSDEFAGCVESLFLFDEMDEIQQAIKHLHGSDPKNLFPDFGLLAPNPSISEEEEEKKFEEEEDEGEKEQDDSDSVNIRDMDPFQSFDGLPQVPDPWSYMDEVLSTTMRSVSSSTSSISTNKAETISSASLDLAGQLAAVDQHNEPIVDRNNLLRTRRSTMGSDVVSSSTAKISTTTQDDDALDDAESLYHSIMNNIDQIGSKPTTTQVFFQSLQPTTSSQSAITTVTTSSSTPLTTAAYEDKLTLNTSLLDEPKVAADLNTNCISNSTDLNCTETDNYISNTLECNTSSIVESSDINLFNSTAESTNDAFSIFEELDAFNMTSAISNDTKAINCSTDPLQNDLNAVNLISPLIISITTSQPLDNTIIVAPENATSRTIYDKFDTTNPEKSTNTSNTNSININSESRTNNASSSTAADTNQFHYV